MARELMEVIDSQVECVPLQGDICGEGPVWRMEERAVYWTDINRYRVHRYTRASGATHTWIFEEPVVSVNLTTDQDRLLLVSWNLFRHLVSDWPSQRRDDCSAFSGPGMSFKDSRIDPRWSLWFGTMRDGVVDDGEAIDAPFEDGVLYRIDPDGSGSEWKHGLGIPNAVAWSPDQTTFYFGDSTVNAIYQFDYDGRSWGNIE